MFLNLNPSNPSELRYIINQRSITESKINYTLYSTMNPHHTFPSKRTLSNTILQIKLDFRFFSYLLRRRNLDEKHKNKKPNTSCAGYGKNINLRDILFFSPNWSKRNRRFSKLKFRNIFVMSIQRISSKLRSVFLVL